MTVETINCRIIKRLDSNRRVSGSLSWWKGIIDFEGREVEVSLSTRMTDNGYESFRVDGAMLSLLPEHARSVRGQIERQDYAAEMARDQRAAAVAKMQAVFGDLSEMEAVSEKQALFANDMRERTLLLLTDIVGKANPTDEEQVKILEDLKAYVRQESSARAWIDLGNGADEYNVVGRIRTATDRWLAARTEKAAA